MFQFILGSVSVTEDASPLLDVELSETTSDLPVDFHLASSTNRTPIESLDARNSELG